MAAATSCAGGAVFAMTSPGPLPRAAGDETGSWYAVAVYARQEKAAAIAIRARGIEVFLPTRMDRRAWSDRVQSVETALFPGYLFVRVVMSAAVRVELLKAGQVLDVVGRLPGGERVARCIPDEEIESLLTLVSSPCNLDPVARLVPGKLVVIAQGPLKGARGIVQELARGKRRLIVQIELLGRGVAAELSAEDVVELAGIS